ncbi:M28 family peptidase [Catenovulum adriaticum]|uniref:Carboxypeptidase Q n=1 Tax=Catenovulum adriaticum TaxID=2984846 RepID=A0ABY7AML1_9ALTE|nr:M28 family peptidase [Catenovulum sp. TS8]WAJ69574.1 M28 family peptidase [Catenovulum sp. TS8]
MQKKLNHLFSLFLFLFLISQNIQANTDPLLKNKNLEHLKQTALADDYSYFVAESLTTEFGARQAGSQAEINSINWLEQQLQEIGLTQINKQKVPVRNWRRHAASAQVTQPYQHQLVTTSLGGSISTTHNGINAQVIRFNSIEDLRSAKPEAVKDKIVYIAKALKQDVHSNEYIKTLNIRQQGAIVAAKLGAKAVIVRSLTTLNSRIAHTGSVLYQADVKKIPAAAISSVDADLLDRLFTKNLPVHLTLTLNNTEDKWLNSYNLVADIPGTEQPDEIILLIAHIDSWDLGTGALDNAAGVGIMLATIKQLMNLEQAPKRSIRLAILTNSQLKQSGMQTFIKTYKDELNQIVAVAESDLGADFITRLDTHLPTSKLTDVDYLHTLVNDLNIERGHNSSTASTNSKYLLPYNVPVVNWVQDSQEYFKYLHSANDTFDKVKLESLQQNVAVYSLFAYVLANSDIDFRAETTKTEEQ